MIDPPGLLALDRAHVWHPYGPMPGRSEPYVVESAEGVRLRLADGRELVDGMSSWWAAIHGYRHPVLDAALVDQSRRMSHVMFGGLTHAPAVELATTLVELTPDGLEHVFLCDSGSVGVEVAVKMALQAQLARGFPARRRLATWRGGYHGDTFHPMSVCDPDGGMHRLWTGVLPAQVFAGAPPADYDEGYAGALADLIAEHAGELAAVIVEPVVQGAGGMRFHHPGYLRVLREVTAAHGVLLIFDEIATGFGRTGEFFAAHHAGVTPRHHVSRQGTHRGISEPGGDAVHPGGGARRLRRRRRTAWRTARPSWATRSPARSRTPPSAFSGHRTGLGRCDVSPAASVPVWSRCGGLPGSLTSASWARSAWCSSIGRSTCPGPRPPRPAPGCGCGRSAT
nr:hypothetical protein GCM10020092_029660 [Actinoplanes digitatis]